MSLNLVAVILTKNEAHHVADCIASLRGWTNAVVVWDSGSTDDTVALAQAAGAFVVHRRFDDYARQRQAAIDSIAAEWILFIDADERATPDLADEIQTSIRNAQFTGYWIPRRNIIVGHEMRGGGFTPDYQLRLLRRDKARYDLSREVHEVVALDGDAGYLRQPLLHYNYATWAQFHRKQRVYARYEAKILADRGLRPRPIISCCNPYESFGGVSSICTAGATGYTACAWRCCWPGIMDLSLIGFFIGLYGEIDMQSITEKSSPSPLAAPLTLAIGDGVALLVFVILGRISHGFTNDWLINVARIVTPFWIGWFALALLLGVYRADLLPKPASLMARSALAWVGGNLVAFALPHADFPKQRNNSLRTDLSGVYWPLSAGLARHLPLVGQHAKEVKRREHRRR